MEYAASHNSETHSVSEISSPFRLQNFTLGYARLDVSCFVWLEFFIVTFYCTQTLHTAKIPDVFRLTCATILALIQTPARRCHKLVIMTNKVFPHFPIFCSNHRFLSVITAGVGTFAKPTPASGSVYCDAGMPRNLPAVFHSAFDAYLAAPVDTSFAACRSVTRVTMVSSLVLILMHFIFVLRALGYYVIGLFCSTHSSSYRMKS